MNKETTEYLMRDSLNYSDASATETWQNPVGNGRVASPSNHDHDTAWDKFDKLLKASEKNWNSMIESLSDSVSKRVCRALISDFKKLIKSDEWQLDDLPVTKGSIQTFVELIKNLDSNVPPIIASDHGGNVIVYWGGKDEHLSFTCFPNETAIYYVSYIDNNKTVKFSGHKRISEILKLLGSHQTLWNKLLKSQKSPQ